MNKIIISLCIIAIFACSIITVGCTKQQDTIIGLDKNGNPIEVYKIPEPEFCLNPRCVVIVEGCEYFVFRTYGCCGFIHKGNCKNPIHIHNGGNHE